MSDPKHKPTPKPQPKRESVDFSEVARRQVRNQTVTNTRPAPPNPHNVKGGRSEEKKR